MVRVLIVSPYAVFPPDHGTSHRIWNLYNAVLQELDTKQGDRLDILFNATSTDPLKYQAMQKTVGSDSFIMPIRIAKAHFFLRQNNLKLVGTFLRKLHRYDCVQLEFPYLLAPLMLAKLFRKKVIVDEHNVEYLFNKDAYETYNPLVRGIILFLTSVAEWVSLHCADLVLCCSSHDRKELGRRYHIDTTKIRVLPNAVSTDALKTKKAKNKTKQTKRQTNTKTDRRTEVTLLFVGSKNHYPNSVAIRTIAETILPQLDSLLAGMKTQKTVEMRFVGKDAPSYLHGLSFEHIRVQVKEQVTDIASELHDADVGLAPLFHGSGTRIKVLEYLATDTIVLATQKATEGLKLQDGFDYICEDDVSHYAQHLSDIIQNPKLYMSLRQQGMETIAQNYEWRSHARRLKKYIKDICSKKRTS
jgi:glycosyltransferase involved in cell wall biosynthesis